MAVVNCLTTAGVILMFNCAFAYSVNEGYAGIVRCQEACRNTYPQHTYEKSGAAQCCERGCRFYKLSACKPACNETTFSCYKACNESYPGSSEQSSACSMGCDLQMPEDERQLSELSDYLEEGEKLIARAKSEQMLSHWMFELLAGFDVFNSVYDDIDSPRADSGDVIVVEQMPGMMVISQYHLASVDKRGSTTTGEAVALAGSLEPQGADEEDDSPCYSLFDDSKLMLYCMLGFSVMMICLITGSKRRPDNRKPNVKIAENLGFMLMNDKEAFVILNHPQPDETFPIPEKKSLI